MIAVNIEYYKLGGSMQSKIKQVLDILFSKKTIEEVQVIDEPVEEDKPTEKVVQEPFISLVETFEENPRRFKATRDKNLWIYTLVDTELNNTFKVTQVYYHNGGFGMVYYSSLSVNGVPFYSYTDTDIHYVYRKLSNYYQVRHEKYTKRAQKRLHNRLMKNYVK